MKYAWIESHRDQFPVSRMCRLMDVSRTGYCQWRVRAPSAREQANEGLDAKVSVIHQGSGGTYGRPRIVRELADQGHQVGHERVRRSLQRQGLRPAYRRPFRITTDSSHKRPVHENVLDRRFDGWQPDRAWAGDITYIHTDEGWLYLAVVLDLASRRIVGWSMSDRIKDDLVCDALTMAFWHRKPAPGLIMHTDRGSQYVSRSYAKLIGQYRMTASMSRRANCWDNAPVESFFKTLKVEHVYRHRYRTRAQARLNIVNWIEGFYNQRRSHSANNFRSPCQAESVCRAA